MRPTCSNRWTNSPKLIWADGLHINSLSFAVRIANNPNSKIVGDLYPMMLFHIATKIIFFSRAHVPIVVLRISPSLAPYCQFLVVAPATVSNVPSKCKDPCGLHELTGPVILHSYTFLQLSG